MPEPVEFSCVELRSPIAPVSLWKEYLCCPLDPGVSFPDAVDFTFPSTAQRSENLILAGN